ncbi:hypothetical protein D3C86_2020630 [compost metagenome]
MRTSDFDEVSGNCIRSLPGLVSAHRWGVSVFQEVRFVLKDAAIDFACGEFPGGFLTLDVNVGLLQAKNFRVSSFNESFRLPRAAGRHFANRQCVYASVRTERLDLVV